MLNWTIEPTEEDLVETPKLNYDCLITFEEFLRRFHIFSREKISHLIGLELYLYDLYINSIEIYKYK
jgi:hypothetical protein